MTVRAEFGPEEWHVSCPLRTIMPWLVCLAIVFVAYRATSQAERAKYLERVRGFVQRGAAATADFQERNAAFFERLRARTRIAPATPIIVVANLLIFAVVLAATIGGRGALVDWGASIGTRTSHGEWWRLVASLFVHTGPLHLLACIVGFFPIGRVLERVVGSVALATVYVVSGVFAGLTAMSVDPLAVSAGASGAVCGVYGLACTTAAWGLVRPPRLTVPWQVLKWLAWPAVIFLGYNIPSGIVPLRAELAGFAVGLLCGAALAEDVAARAVPVRRTAGLLSLASLVALVMAVPLFDIIDVRQDVNRLLAVDERTAATFRSAVAELVVGRTTEKAMIDLIEGEIIPVLEREGPRLASAGTVPADQKALRTAAADYLRVRVASWRLRANAYRKGSLAMLRQADTEEGKARDLLARLPYHPAPI